MTRPVSPAMSTVRVITLIVLAVLLGACSDKADSGSSGGNGSAGSPSGQEKPDGGASEAERYPVGQSGPTLKPFGDDAGPIALEIDGVPVPKSTIDRYVRIWKMRQPGTSDKTILRAAIEEGIVPLAAMYAKNKDDVGILSERAWQAWKRLEAGEQWNVVAAEESDDPNAPVNFGSQGIRRRLAVPGLPPVHPEIEQRAFSRPDEKHHEPCITPLGIVIVRAAKETRLPNQSDGEIQREIFRILFAWDPDYRAMLRSFDPSWPEARQQAFADRLKRHKEGMKRRIKAAKVKVLDESYRGVIYGFRLKKS